MTTLSSISCSTSNVEPAFILDMPNDVTVLFFEWLRLPDVEVSCLVCRSWNELLGLGSVWQRLLEWHYSKHTITLQEGETHQSTYRKLHRLISNRNHFVYSRSNLCLGSDSRWIMAIVDEKLIHYSFTNGDIEIIDSNSLKRERHFRLRVEGLHPIRGGRRLRLVHDEMSGTLYIAIEDKLFPFDSRPFLVKGGKIQLQKTKDLSSLLSASMFAITGDKSYSVLGKKIIIHPLQSNQQDVDLKCSDYITSILVTDKKLFAGTGKTIEIWDLSNNTRIDSLEGHSDMIISMAQRENYLFSLTIWGELKTWNVDSRKCIATHTFQTSEEIIRLEFQGKRLFAKTKKEILIFDFTADHNTILQEIADLLEKNDPSSTSSALERLSRLPEYILKKIKAESQYTSNPLILCQLIRNVLAAPKSLEHPRETKRKNESESS